MKAEDVKVFGVIGAGQMGHGIALVAALSGLQVILNDIKMEFAERGLQNIIQILSRNVDKGKMTKEQKDATIERIKLSADLRDLSGVDFVVEAAVENQEVKFQIFRDIDEICLPHAILATNTSSIPIGRIAAQTKRPER